METKDSNAKYVLPTDSKPQPVYQDIAQHDETLLAEPDVAWSRSTSRKIRRGRNYVETPQWLILNKPGVPPKKMIHEARDRVLEHNPKLHIAGMHLGSLEKDLDDFGWHLEKYWNFAVDTTHPNGIPGVWRSGKSSRLSLKVSGPSDLRHRSRCQSSRRHAQAVKECEQTYTNDWKFFATSETIQVEGRTVHVLSCPKVRSRRSNDKNDQRWIRGLS